MKKLILMFLLVIIVCGYAKVFYEENLIEKHYIMEGE